MSRIYISKSLAILTTVVVTSAAASSALARAMISSQQFKEQIQEHRHRVLTDAQAILDQYSSDFPALRSLPSELRNKLFNAYVELHDAPKVMSKAQLAAWNYQGEKSIFQNLHEVYGTDLKERPQFIEDLNAIEGQMKKNMMNARFSGIEPNLMNRVLREVQYIEWIADITDTLHMRGVELGVNFEWNSAERYFRHRDDARAAKMARWLGKSRYIQKMYGQYCTGIFVK